MEHPLSDDPDEEAVKTALAGIERATLSAKAAYDACASAGAGRVSWYFSQPKGESYMAHKESFLEAIYVALSFCQTVGRDEWVIVGQYGYITLRCVRRFKEVPSLRCEGCPLVYVGRLRHIVVYLWPGEHALDFFAGTQGKAARGTLEGVTLRCGT